MKRARFLAFLAIILSITYAHPRHLDSANLTSVKDTLSSSRLSFVGALGSGNSSGSSIAILKTSSLPGFATSDDNLNLFTGDTLKIGTSSNYTLIDVIDDASDNQIQIYSPLGGLQTIAADTPVIATRSAQHVVTFTPVSIVSNGYYRVRIKATDGTQAQTQDGIPDYDGFDATDSFSSTYVDCSSADSGSAAVEYSGDTNCPSGYSCFFCGYSGNNTLAAKTINVGTTATAQQLINPSPSSTSAEHGKASTSGGYDLYTFYVDHMDASYNLIDSTQGKIAVVDSVRVTAVVEPTIEFEIDGIASGQTACGNALDVTTTATTVPFGTVSISSFVDAAQNLTVSTNAAGGYTVTTLESDQLNRIIGTGLDTSTSIADTAGDNGSATHAVKDEWSTTSTKGFGYSIENVDATSAVFEYNDSDGTCTGTYCAKQFADNANTEAAQQIFYASAPADSQNAYVCYRIIISTTQQAGTYTNSVTYVASATF